MYFHSVDNILVPTASFVGSRDRIWTHFDPRVWLGAWRTSSKAVDTIRGVHPGPDVMDRALGDGPSFWPKKNMSGLGSGRLTPLRSIPSKSACS